MCPFKKSGFTLVEVLISVAILSTLMMALIESQSETTLLLSFTVKYEKAQKHVREELLRIFRDSKDESISFSEGTFKEEEEMFGYSWRKEVIEEAIFTVPMLKVIYSVSWEDSFRNHSYESSVYVPKN